MDLQFLNDISLVKTETKTRHTSVDTTPAQGAHLRLMADGRIFPSAQLVEDHSLEYVAKDEEVGQGFDIIDTSKFINYPQENPRLVMVALVDKDMPKVDLFGSVGYNPEGGAPKTSVITQGSSTTGKWLIALLEEVYGVVLFEDERFVDLIINTDFGLTTPNNIYHFPKTVNRGDHKGETTYQRRTDTEMWPLTIAPSSVVTVVTEPTIEEEAAAEVAPLETEQVADQLEVGSNSADDFLASLENDDTKEEENTDTESLIKDENEIVED